MTDLCPCCSVRRVIVRGLCKACYERRRLRGGLESFPARFHVSPYSRAPDVDEIAVERACLGDRVRLTIRERAEVVRVLTGRGHTAREIARRVGIAPRTVQRYRAGHVKTAARAA